MLGQGFAPGMLQNKRIPDILDTSGPNGGLCGPTGWQREVGLSAAGMEL